MLEKNYKEIDIDKIVANENQPRTVFDDESIEELAKSIQENGLIQPIIVRRVDDRYQIIAGERRYRACNLAGLKVVPCIIKNIDDKQLDTLAIIENIQRVDLSPIEEASAYKVLIDRYGMSQSEVAKQVGKQQSTIANKLRLLKLSEDVRYALKNKQITERHARAMLSLDNEQQYIILKQIIKYKLSVKETEALIAQPIKEDKIKKSKGLEKKFSRNIKIAINTINQATTLVKQSGVDITSDSEETDEEYIITLRVKK